MANYSKSNFYVPTTNDSTSIKIRDIKNNIKYTIYNNSETTFFVSDNRVIIRTEGDLSDIVLDFSTRIEAVQVLSILNVEFAKIRQNINNKKQHDFVEDVTEIVNTIIDLGGSSSGYLSTSGGIMFGDIDMNLNNITQLTSIQNINTNLSISNTDNSTISTLNYSVDSFSFNVIELSGNVSTVVSGNVIDGFKVITRNSLGNKNKFELLINGGIKFTDINSGAAYIRGTNVIDGTIYNLPSKNGIQTFAMLSDLTGGNWKADGSYGPATGNWNMGNNSITNVAFIGYGSTNIQSINRQFINLISTSSSNTEVFFGLNSTSSGSSNWYTIDSDNNTAKIYLDSLLGIGINSTNNNGSQIWLNTSNVVSNDTFLFPNKNGTGGTFAMLSDLSTYLPLSGGIMFGNIDINTNSLLRVNNITDFDGDLSYNVNDRVFYKKDGDVGLDYENGVFLHRVSLGDGGLGSINLFPNVVLNSYSPLSAFRTTASFYNYGGFKIESSTDQLLTLGLDNLSGVYLQTNGNTLLNTYIKNDDVTAEYIVQFPDKSSNQTFAMLSDITETSITINGSNGTNFNLTTDNILEGGTNFYYTDVRVSANTNVINGVTAYSWGNHNTSGYIKNVNGLTGTTITLTTSNITEGTNFYYLDSRARSSISATNPLSYNNSTGVISIFQSTSTSGGYLTSTDWNTFNNKINTITINGSSGTNFTLTTSNINEGTNFYYTDVRVNANSNVINGATAYSWGNHSTAGYQLALGYTPVNKAGDTGIGALQISNTTISTSSSSGALIVAGGVGIGGNLNVTGQILFVSGSLSSGSNINLNSTTLNLQSNNSSGTGIGISTINNSSYAYLKTTSLTQSETFEFPNKSGAGGTFAMLSDLATKANNRTWTTVAWQNAVNINLVSGSNFKNITGVTGSQIITYDGGNALVNGANTAFQINKPNTGSIAITLPTTSVIFLDIAPSESSLSTNVVTLTGSAGSKYLFEIREANGDMVTLISKIASDSVINSPKVFYCSNTIIAVGTSTLNSDVTLFTIPYIANSWGTNTTIRFLATCIGGASTNSKTFKLYDQALGATNGLIYSFNNAAASQVLSREYVMLCHTSNSQTISNVGSSSAEVTKAIDLTVNRTLVASCNINNVSEAASAYKGLLIIQYN